MRTLALNSRTRPTFFDLYRIKQPVTAVVSFGHRVSGVFIALLVPFLIALLQFSVASPEGWRRAVSIAGSGWARVIAVLAVWAFAHHLFAGVRHLLFDLHVGAGAAEGPLRLKASRAGAWAVLAAEACVLILAIVALA